MTRALILRCTLATAFAIAAGPVSSQQADLVVPPATVSGTIASADETFALFAASMSLAQIEGAQLVLKRGRRAEVREFAQTIVRVHTQTLDELRRIAVARGLKLPATATGRHADMVTKLSGLTAPDLDDAFVQRFGVDAHKEAIALYDRQAAEGHDPALRKHAVNAAAVLRERMAAAQKLAHVPAGPR